MKLERIINALELVSDDGCSFMNAKTGKLFHIYNTELEYAQNGFAVYDSLPDWQRLNIQLARRIIRSNCYVPLPVKEEIDEFQIMLNFCSSVSNYKIIDEIYNSLKSNNIDVMILNEMIMQNGLGNEWYKYKREAFKKIAIEWSKKNNIEFV